MKKITAFIKPNKLDDVSHVLHKIDRLTGLSVSEVRGFGRGRGKQEGAPDSELFGFVAHFRVEIVCHDDLVEPVCQAIESSAHTGLRGDGKIYVGPVEQAVRISTGERGEAAV